MATPTNALIPRFRSAFATPMPEMIEMIVPGTSVPGQIKPTAKVVVGQLYRQPGAASPLILF